MLCRVDELKNRNPKLKGFSQDELTTIRESTQPTPRFSIPSEDEFSIKVLQTRTLLQRISSSPDTITQLKNKYAKSIKQSQEKQYSRQIDFVINQNKDRFDELKKKISQLNDLIEYEDKQEPQYNMKKNILFGLGGQLAQIIQKQKTQVEGFKQCVREKVERQVKMIDQQLDDKQVQYYIDHPEEAQKMLQGKIYGQASTNLKNAVCDIQDKLHDIQKLQKSVSHCLQLFKQLQGLVFAQGQMIDNIQKNVNEAKDYIDRSVQTLTVAKKSHKSYKKKMWCAFIILFIILLVIIIPVAVSRKK